MRYLVAAFVIIALIVALERAQGTIPEPDIALPDPVTDADYYESGRPRPAKVELGRMLFFDKILSGNENISCATCHHPDHATSDGVALSFGEGPDGLGPDRKAGETRKTAVHERVPRNSPALFNLGALEFTRMFHDGRVEADSNGYYEGGFITPAKWKLPKGLDNVLAAQAMFPVGSPTEMAGQKGENGIADARSLNNASGAGGVWEQIAARLAANAEYVTMFKAAYPERVRDADDITYVLAANAIAAFETQAFRADDSPFDRYLRGNRQSLSNDAKQGMALFYGKANCSSCHSGQFQTDHDFHAVAMPQIGPGKSDGWNGGYWRSTGIKAFPEDHGRGRVTVREEDRYKFRTPSLRNVAMTGPWGHDGAYTDLEDVVRHHLDPVSALREYDVNEARLHELEKALEITARGSSIDANWLSERSLDGLRQIDGWVQDSDELRELIAQANELDPIALTDEEVEQLIAFLQSLTDAASTDLAKLVPLSVPSGLSVDD